MTRKYFMLAVDVDPDHLTRGMDNETLASLLRDHLAVALEKLEGKSIFSNPAIEAEETLGHKATVGDRGLIEELYSSWSKKDLLEDVIEHMMSEQIKSIADTVRAERANE